MSAIKVGDSVIGVGSPILNRFIAKIGKVESSGVIRFGDSTQNDSLYRGVIKVPEKGDIMHLTKDLYGLAAGSSVTVKSYDQSGRLISASRPGSTVDYSFWFYSGGRGNEVEPSGSSNTPVTEIKKRSPRRGDIMYNLMPTSTIEFGATLRVTAVEGTLVHAYNLEIGGDSYIFWYNNPTQKDQISFENPLVGVSTKIVTRGMDMESNAMRDWMLNREVKQPGIVINEEKEDFQIKTKKKLNL